jgi:hypothetical protein
MTNVISIAEVSSQKKVALINKYAELTSKLAKLKTELEECKVEAIELLGEGTHETSRAKVTINWVERPILDQAKAKSFLTPAQLDKCFKTSSFHDVRVKLF